MDDNALLRAYQEGRSEQAFTELVQRHLPVVYATALRLVYDSQAAQDVAQCVFIQLARKSWSVHDGHSLPGWLYRTTQRMSFDHQRGERRRRHREAEAMKLAEPNQISADPWEQLAPLLDETLRRLSRIEQDAVLLHYFHGKSYREVGTALDLKESAAHKRVERALEKIRRHFARQGVATTTALLGSVMSVHASTPPPVGLQAKIVGASLASAAKPAGLALVFRKILLMKTQTKITLAVAAVVLAACIPLTLQYQFISRLEQEVSNLEKDKITRKTELGRTLGQLQDANTRLQKLSAFTFTPSDKSTGPSQQGSVRLDLSIVEKLGFRSFDDTSFKLTDEAVNLLGLTPAEAQQMQAVLDDAKTGLENRNRTVIRTLPVNAPGDQRITDFFNSHTGQKSVYYLPPFTKEEALAVMGEFVLKIQKILGPDRGNIFIEKSDSTNTVGLGEGTTIAFVDSTTPDGKPSTTSYILYVNPNGNESHSLIMTGADAVPPQLQGVFEERKTNPPASAP